MCAFDINEITKNLGVWGADTSREGMTGALLFNNQASSNKFGHIYLFGKFGTQTSNNIQFQSDITTNYTEENYAVNDHWAINPVKYTLQGLIGEVIYTPARGIVAPYAERARDFLTPLNILSPTVDNYTLSAVNLARQVDENIARYEQAAKTALRTSGMSIGYSTSNQQYIIEELEKLWTSRQLITIYTPYGAYSDMAIANVNGSQDKSKYQTTLEIQLQQWHTTGTITRKATKDEKSQLQRIQSSTTQQQGLAGVRKVQLNDGSFLYTTLGGYIK